MLKNQEIKDICKECKYSFPDCQPDEDEVEIDTQENIISCQNFKKLDSLHYFD